MLSFIFQPISMLCKGVLANDSSRQLACGFTIGMMIGLIPKDNLISWSLMVLLCALHVNRPVGLLGAFLFSWVAVLTDPFAHKIGLQVLNIPSLEPYWIWLYDQPLGPWLHFENTVVMGSLLLAIYVAYPVYWVSYLVISRIREKIVARIRRYRVQQLATAMNVGAQWGTGS